MLSSTFYQIHTHHRTCGRGLEACAFATLAIHWSIALGWCVASSIDRTTSLRKRIFRSFASATCISSSSSTVLLTSAASRTTSTPVVKSSLPSGRGILVYSYGPGVRRLSNQKWPDQKHSYLNSIKRKSYRWDKIGQKWLQPRADINIFRDVRIYKLNDRG